MTDTSHSMSPQLRARIAGGLYVVVIIAGVFTQVTHMVLIDRGNAGATVANILASEGLFRLAFVSDLVGVIGYVVVTVLLYDLFKPVSQTGSLLAMVFSTLGCGVLAATFVFSLAPVFLIGGAHYLAPLQQGQLQAAAMVCMKLYGLGYTIGMVFFGLYCFTLGGLIMQSVLLPRLIGLALAIAGIADLIDSFSYFMSPPLSAALSAYTSVPAIVGEGSLCVWLLVVGVDSPRWIEMVSRQLPSHA